MNGVWLDRERDSVCVCNQRLESSQRYSCKFKYFVFGVINPQCIGTTILIDVGNPSPVDIFYKALPQREIKFCLKTKQNA